MFITPVLRTDKLVPCKNKSSSPPVKSVPSTRISLPLTFDLGVLKSCY